MPVPLDELSPVPRYQQVAALIRAQIESGELGEGDPIPTREQMQQEYGVARDTAAKALRVLVDEGLVVVVPGLGARVARRLGSKKDTPGGLLKADPREVFPVCPRDSLAPLGALRGGVGVNRAG